LILRHNENVLEVIGAVLCDEYVVFVRLAAVFTNLSKSSRLMYRQVSRFRPQRACLSKMPSKSIFD
jgi:hypothetical protein